MNPLDLVFTPRCIFCERILYAGVKERICPYCHPERFVLPEGGCEICGRPMAGIKKVCSACQLHGTTISGHSVYQYEGIVRQAVQRFKYGNMKGYGAYFARQIWMRWGGYIRELEPEALVPVPLHAERKRRRGYNQAQVIAEALMGESGIPVRSVLERVHSTTPQMSLGYSQRAENVKDVFAVKSGEKVPDKILLIDDIYTTGNTIEACAKALLDGNSGAKVNFLTIAAKIYKEST